MGTATPDTPIKNSGMQGGFERLVLAGCVCLLSIGHLLLEESGATDIATVAIACAYFFASSAWMYLAEKRNDKGQLISFIAAIDSVVGAFAVASLFDSYALTALLYILIAFNSVIRGSMQCFALDSLAFVLGTAIASVLSANGPWVLLPSGPILIGFLLFMLLYLLVYANGIQRRIRKINMTNQKLYNEQLLHKLRSYKLSRYVSPTVWNAISQGRETSLKTERKRITVFFSDIQGFSSLSEELEAETLTELLNNYLTEMLKIASAHRGTIDKFMGDGIMVLFGDSNSEGLKSDCLRCISMAVNMRKKMSELETLWFNKGIKKPLRIRMGINTGYCTVGSFGTSDYMDYTVLGTHVNLASRLESAADPGEILVSHETWSLIKDVVMCRDKGEISAKGFSHPIKVYQVVDFRKDMGKHQSYFEERAEGFSMHLDLEKIKNFDKQRIIDNLESAARNLRDKVIR